MNSYGLDAESWCCPGLVQQQGATDPIWPHTCYHGWQTDQVGGVFVESGPGPRQAGHIWPGRWDGAGAQGELWYAPYMSLRQAPVVGRNMQGVEHGSSPGLAPSLLHNPTHACYSWTLVPAHWQPHPIYFAKCALSTGVLDWRPGRQCSSPKFICSGLASTFLSQPVFHASKKYKITKCSYRTDASVKYISVTGGGLWSAITIRLLIFLWMMQNINLINKHFSKKQLLKKVKQTPN